jgi:hypothetical protein
MPHVPATGNGSRPENGVYGASPLALAAEVSAREERDEKRLLQLREARMEAEGSEKEREEKALQNWLKNCCLPPDEAKRYLRRQKAIPQKMRPSRASQGTGERALKREPAPRPLPRRGT